MFNLQILLISFFVVFFIFLIVIVACYTQIRVAEEQNSNVGVVKKAEYSKFKDSRFEELEKKIYVNTRFVDMFKNDIDDLYDQILALEKRLESLENKGGLT